MPEAAGIYGCPERTMRWLVAEGRVTGAVKQLRPIPHYLIPEVFEVLPPESEMGKRLWEAAKWQKGPVQLRG